MAMQAMTELRQLVQHAESMRNDALRVFQPGTFMPGDVSVQGDLYLVCLAKLPASCRVRFDRQLAKGMTQGSRHVLAKGQCYDAAAVEVVQAIEQATGVEVQARYVGPVFQGPALLTHPEHGDQEWVEPCVVAVVYQRSLDAEEREQRVRD